MGPKVEAACRFARATGKRAAIGDLASLERIIAGEAGHDHRHEWQRDRLRLMSLVT
jgi:carbamate kinase